MGTDDWSALTGTPERSSRAARVRERRAGVRTMIERRSQDRSRSFGSWLASLPRYDGEAMELDEWLDPSRWSSEEAFHEAQEAAEFFHNGYLHEAEQEVYDAMELASCAAGRRRERSATMQRRNAGATDWSVLTGQAEELPAGGGVPSGLDMEVIDTANGDDLEDFLSDDSDERRDLAQEDLDLVREGLRDLLSKAADDEERQKRIQEVEKKFGGVNEAMLVPIEDEDSDDGAGDMDQGGGELDLGEGAGGDPLEDL